MKVIFLLLLSAACSSLAAQNKFISGTVTDKNHRPVPQASVFIPGISECKTDHNGIFKLNITTCSACRTGSVVSVRVNSAEGFAEKQYTIPTNLQTSPCDIQLQTSNKLNISGIVRDKASGRFLSGVEVTPVIQDYDGVLPSVRTDSRGVFQVVLLKSSIGGQQAIRINCLGSNAGSYCDKSEVVFINQYDPVNIDLEVCATAPAIKRTLKVNDYIRTDILVEPGDEIQIKASGTIKVGDWVGTSGPDGLRSGVFGMSLSSYNHFPDWNHAVLVYRFGETGEWQFYDSNKTNKHSVQEKGFLEVAINDKDLSNNSGAYDVEISISR